jgi:hypothetical protein
VNCHLGDIINYNDTVLAYDLLQSNNPELDEFIVNYKNQISDMIVVRKTYPKYLKKQNKERNWKLKHLDKK